MKMDKVGTFITNNINFLVVVLCFAVSLYVQHINNTAKISEISAKCDLFEAKLEDQYKKIDAIKLDKSVFEATVAQFATIRDDVKEVRADVKELLKK